MPEFKLPQFSADMSKEELLEAVAKQNKTLTWLIQHLDDINILDLDGQKLFPVSVNGEQKLIALSVKDGQILDLNGSKNWDLSVANQQLANMDGAKLFLNSVLNDVLVSMDGAKLFALSTPFGNLRNTRLSGSQYYSLAAGEKAFIYVPHTNIYQFAGPPMIAEQGTSNQFLFPIGYDEALINPPLNVTVWCTYYGVSSFQIALWNHGSSAVSGTFSWYRDGIY